MTSSLPIGKGQAMESALFEFVICPPNEQRKHKKAAIQQRISGFSID
jgi:hypothetical protein